MKLLANGSLIALHTLHRSTMESAVTKDGTTWESVTLKCEGRGEGKVVEKCDVG